MTCSAVECIKMTTLEQKHKPLRFNAGITAEDLKINGEILALEIIKVRTHFADLHPRRYSRWLSEVMNRVFTNDVNNIQAFIYVCRYIDLHEGFALGTHEGYSYYNLKHCVMNFLSSIKGLGEYCVEGDVRHLTRYCTFLNQSEVKSPHIGRGITMLAMLCKGRMTLQELSKPGGKLCLTPNPKFREDTQMMSSLNWKLARFFEIKKEELNKLGLRSDLLQLFSVPVEIKAYIRWLPVSTYREFLLPFMCEDVGCYLSYFANVLAEDFGVEVIEDEKRDAHERDFDVDMKERVKPGQCEVEDKDKEAKEEAERKAKILERERRVRRYRVDPYYTFDEQLCSCRSHHHITPEEGAAMLRDNGLILYRKIAKYLGVNVAAERKRMTWESTRGDIHEMDVQRRLEQETGGVHLSCPAGTADIVSKTQLIEIKRWSQWKSALGQLLAYSEYILGKQLRVHFFGSKPKKGLDVIMQCFSKYNIIISEEAFIDATWQTRTLTKVNTF